MNSKNRQLRLMMLALMLIPFIGVYAQVNEITLSKPGRLGKEIGKSADTITTLKVNGDINGEDIEFMVSMPKLNSLDLGNARIFDDYSYPAQNKIASGLSRYIGNNNSAAKSYNKQTLLISGSRFYRKVIMPIMCNNLVILPPQPTDSVYSLEFCQMGRLVAASGINSITCSKLFLPMIIDVKNFTFDVAKHKSITPCIIMQQNEVKLRVWHWGIDELMAYCKRNNIASFDNVLPGSFSAIKGDTLNLSQVNIKTIGAYVFANCPAKYVIMPRSVENISDLAFEKSNVESVEFTGEYAPAFIGDKNKNDFYARQYYPVDVSSWNFSIIVPEKYYQNYQLGEWKELVVKKDNAISKYEFVIEKPGTLSSYLTNEIIKGAEGLTLKGILYDTEIDLLNECKGLKYLDLSCCYVAKSPQTIEKERASREFQLAVLQQLGEITQKDAKSKFEQGKISYAEALNNVMWGQYAESVAKQASQNKVEADENCLCPELNLKLLKEYHMPMQLKIIGPIGYFPALEKIVLPPSATQIYYYAFSGTCSIKEISFPNSIEYIGNGAFKNCKSLTKLDFSNTNLKGVVINRKGYGGEDSSLFYGCDNLIEVRFPATLTTLEDEGDVPRRCVLYFNSLEAPKGYCYWEPQVIHVQRGAKAGWSIWIAKGINVIDDL